jgi:hypothetical protein
MFLGAFIFQCAKCYIAGAENTTLERSGASRSVAGGLLLLQLTTIHFENLRVSNTCSFNLEFPLNVYAVGKKMYLK